MDLELSGKRAFVAASSRGLGLATAKRLANEGVRVTISSRSATNLKEARDEILSETDADTDAVRVVDCDITDRSLIDAAIQTTAESFGGLDILVNNHGGPPAVTFNEADETQWDSAYELVIKSNIWLISAALPYLQESDHGAIATVTSASAREPSENHALSNVFRLGLYGLSKTIAVEHPSIRSNIVAPRLVMTDRVEYKTRRRAEYRGISEQKARQAREEEVLRGRFGETQEFADAVAFVVSPRASYITGDVIRVDGGWTHGVL
jgi:NAD(P)-dependent dehydrogenase (short-subunit alcohol dehydrogenase family)